MHITQMGNLETLDDEPGIILQGTKEEVKAAADLFLHNVRIVSVLRLEAIIEAATDRDANACYQLAFSALHIPAK
jgi:hypothetical protein